MPGEPIQVSWRGVNYNVSCYKTQSVGKGHCIAVWEDTTELCTLKKELEMKSVMVAFVVIDNFSEAVQFIQDKQRTALALIGSTLDAWTASLGGILKEYDKDKFIIIFEQRHFEKLDESRFDILDKIREIEIDNINMPFTASIGVSKNFRHACRKGKRGTKRSPTLRFSAAATRQSSRAKAVWNTTVAAPNRCRKRPKSVRA